MSPLSTLPPPAPPIPFAIETVGELARKIVIDDVVEDFSLPVLPVAGSVRDLSGSWLSVDKAISSIDTDWSKRGDSVKVAQIDVIPMSPSVPPHAVSAPRLEPEKSRETVFDDSQNFQGEREKGGCVIT